MRILGIDPGKKTGWALYDSMAKRVAATWTADGAAFPSGVDEIRHLDAVVIERPMGYGATHPAVVDAAWVAGQLYSGASVFLCNVHQLTRIEVKNILRTATMGEFTMQKTNDVWAALKWLHGGEKADEKPKRKKGVQVSSGGPLGHASGHERDAVAVAVAWWLQHKEKTDGK